MKKLIFGIGITVICSGCCGVRVTTPQWSATGFSLFKEISIPKAEAKIGNDTVLKLQGYNGNTDNETIGSIIGAAIKAAK